MAEREPIVIPSRAHPQCCRDAGFIIDEHCYPHLAYKGERFNPTEKKQVYTELESQLIIACVNANVPLRTT